MSSSSAAGVSRPWPEVILSGRPFLGATAISKQFDLECAVRFSRPENGASLVAAAAGRGVDAITPMNNPTLLHALDMASERCRLQVYPIIPNVIGYVRDATDYGMVGAGLRHLRRLGPGDLLAIGLRGLARARGVLTRDFRTILSLLIEVEMAAFKKFRPSLVLLHPQVTDIAVALGNHEALRVFADVVQRRFGAQAGVVTHNFGALLRALDRSRIDIGVVVAPFNPKGFLMKPNRETCESLLRGTERYVIADRVTAGGTQSLEDAFAYLNAMGIRSAVVDVAEAAEVDAVVASRRIDGKRSAASA